MYKWIEPIIGPWGGLLTLALPNALFLWLHRREESIGKLMRPLATSTILTAIFYRIGLEHVIYEFVPLLALSSLVAVVVWRSWSHPDLREHVIPFATAVGLSVVFYRVGFWLGGETGWGLGGASLGFGLVIFVICAFNSIINRTFNDLIGGLVADLIFSDGGSRKKVDEKLPSLHLLRHWRDNGWEGKAYRTAVKFLREDTAAYQYWIFAAETAAQNGGMEGAERLIQRLCQSEAFSKDQKDFAVVKLEDWAKDANYGLKSQFRKPAQSVEPMKPLKRAHQLRDEGKLHEAEMDLRRLLMKEPENLSASLTLMQLYTQDMKRPEKAEQLLRKLEKKDFVPEAYVEFAKRSLNEWRAAPAIEA